jgi:hypothetical protein
MQQITKDIVAVVAILLFLVTASMDAEFFAAGWLHSMMMDNPVRHVWQARFDFLAYLRIPILITAWIILSAIYFALRRWVNSHHKISN